MNLPGNIARFAPRALARVLPCVALLVVGALVVTPDASAQIGVARDDSYTIEEDSGNNNLQVLENDDSDDDLELVQVSVPTSGTAEIRNDVIRYRPNTDFFGIDVFTYVVLDDDNEPSVATVTVTVLGINDDPRAENDELTVEEDTSNNTLVVLANDSDADAETLVITDVDTPNQGGTVSINIDGGSLLYTPLAGFNGEERFRYTIEDAAGESDEAEVRVTVVGDNDAPTANDDSYTIDEDSGDSDLDVLTNDTDPDPGDELTIVGVDVPNGGVVSIEGGDRLRYRPNDNFAGTETFSYTIEDEDGLTATATVTVTVTGVNDAPIAVDDVFAVDEDSEGNALAVLANDTDDEAFGLTITAVGAPSQGGQVEIVDGATLRYSPAAEFNGAETFTYTIADESAATANATVTVNVESQDDAPIIDPNPIPDQTVEENEPASIDLREFVTDRDSAGSLVFELAPGSDPLPPGLELSSTGVISGTPTSSGSVGSYSISFVVRDATNATTSAPFTLTVLGAGRVDLAIAVTAMPNPVATNEPVTWQFTITNGAPGTSAPSVRVDILVGGQVPFAFDPPAAGCMLTEAGNETRIGCALQEPIAGGGSATISLTGRGIQAGDIVATATVTIDASAPIDEVEDNDTQSATLSVAQSVSDSPTQRIGNIDARAVAAGDLNDDGFADLAVATGPSQATLVLFNVVDPTNDNKRALSDPATTTVGSIGLDNAVALADLDADGDLDIVTAGGSGRGNAILRNDASDGFAAIGLGGAAADSRAVAIGDVDGDGILDLVFGNVGPNTLYRGTGVVSAFGAAQPFGDGETGDLALVDLIGDTLPEVVLANADGDARIYRNDGGGFVLDRSLSTGPTTSVESGDFNGDGLADLVFGRDAANGSGSASNLVFLNTASTSGGFFLAEELGAAATAAVTGTDTDLDDDTDLVFLNQAGAHQIYVNSGNASGDFVLHPRQFVEAGGIAAVAASLGIDDRLDLAVVGSRGVAVFYSDGEGNLGLGDVEAPVLQLIGEGNVTQVVESTYVDAGAQASDAQDGDLTDRIVVDNPVDPNIVGTYTVRYEVTDRSGNSAVPLTRTVQVQAREGAEGGGGGGVGLALLALLMLSVALRATRVMPPSPRLREFRIKALRSHDHRVAREEERSGRH